MWPPHLTSSLNYAIVMMLSSKGHIVLCVQLILNLLFMSSCNESDMPFATKNNEYDVIYSVAYATTESLHNIAHVEYTTPNGVQSYFLPENDVNVFIDKVPKGSKLRISTYLDVEELLPNTKARISIEVRRGDENDYHEVASIEGVCPLASHPLEVSYDLP